jgi:plasmid maintenance system killer protein
MRRRGCTIYLTVRIRTTPQSGSTLVVLALTTVKQQATVSRVKIRNFVHKGLKRLYAEDTAKGVPPATVDKLRKMLAFLDDMQDAEELRNLPAWNVHTLTGGPQGNMEPQRYPEPAANVPHRCYRARNLRPKPRGL